SVGSFGLRVVGAPLIRDRRVEAEPAYAPPRIETDRVALLVHRRVAGGGAPEAGGGGRGGAERDPGERARAVHRAADRTTIGRVAARTGRSHAIGVEPREHRLQVQALGRCPLQAFDDREVLTAVRSYLCVGLPVATGQLVLDVHPRNVVLDLR